MSRAARCLLTPRCLLMSLAVAHRPWGMLLKQTEKVLLKTMLVVIQVETMMVVQLTMLGQCMSRRAMRGRCRWRNMREMLSKRAIPPRG